MNLKGHLQAFHEGEASHHTAKAEQFAKLADAHTALAQHLNATDQIQAQLHRDAHACCKAMAAEHVESAERHLAFHKSIGEIPTEEIGRPSSSAEPASLKSISDKLDKLFNQVVPSAVRAVPTVIPRSGQPSPGSEKNIPPELGRFAGEKIA
jgi:hypothetical protein